MNILQEERAKWLRERKNYIGGSDIGCILGLSKYKSSLDIYIDKTTDTIDESTSEAAHWGNMLENVVAEEYSTRIGLKLEKPKELITHPEYNFLAANIDRWVGAKESKYILECKTASFMKSREWGAEGTDQIPEQYLCQVAYYAAICNVDKVDIAVLIGGQDFRIYTYYRNKDFEDKLLRAAVAFWNNYVVKKIPPEASRIEDINKLYTRSNGLEIEASQETIQHIEKLKEIKLQEKTIRESKESVMSEIKKYMQNNEVLTINGDVIATWRSTKPRMNFDSGRLRSENQELYQKYLNEGKVARIFTLK